MNIFRSNLRDTKYGFKYGLGKVDLPSTTKDEENGDSNFEIIQKSHNLGRITYG